MILVNRKPDLMIFTLVIMLLVGCSNNHTILPGKKIPNTKIPTCDKGGDQRSYQHGIDFIPISNTQYALVWSSSGSAVDVSNSTVWEHDVYYSFIDPTKPAIKPINLISRDEAQEPASTAISADGHIMITMEDGWEPTIVLEQRYGIYNSDFSPTPKAYPQVVPVAGGHSGHVAAIDNRFVIFYSEEWVTGGGVDNLGSGDDVYAAVYDSNGNFLYQKNIAVGHITRDWWPWVEGSDNYACMIWQRFVNNEIYSDLMISILNPLTGDFTVAEKTIETNMEYYTYSVAAIPGLDQFLIMGVHKDGTGFGILIDENGNELSRNNNLPAIVRESQPALRTINGNLFIAQAKADGGIMVLKLTSSIELVKTIDNEYIWGYGGTDGIWMNDNQIYMVSLSNCGLIEMKFDF
ncbi:MAG: hypothetical protein L3J06_03895 [Cyclobacteriaceae bacterium]|nr:hypothetical protein [Cyclobacteriaceae bacterium]